MLVVNGSVGDQFVNIVGKYIIAFKHTEIHDLQLSFINSDMDFNPLAILDLSLT